jgi:hypothetical protein
MPLFPSPHRYPAECPALLLDEHQLGAGERVEPAAYEQGEDRHREIRTFTPWLASVAARMTQAEFDRFSDWVDDELRAGTLPFDIQVHSLVGAGGQWWQARFVPSSDQGPYRYEARSGPRYLVSASLILLDGPYDTRTEPGLRGWAVGRGDATWLGLDTSVLRGWAVGEGSATLSAPQADFHGWAVGEGDATGRFPDWLQLDDGSFLLLDDGVGRIDL